MDQGGALGRLALRARGGLRRWSLGSVVALAAVGAYILVLGYLALAKYATFHATFEDLGIENQALWLLNHGGIAEYYSSGFNQIYPLQAQKPILFLVLPLYGIYPHPETLIVLATVSLGAAGIPLFLTARRWLQSQAYALVVLFGYLAFFPVASANLFDFHYEDLFPLGFFAMTWAFASGHRRGMYLAAILTAAINPLALVTVLAFLVFTSLPGPRERLGRSWLTSAWREFFRDYRTPLLFGALVGLLIIYRLSGVLYTAGVGAGSSGASPGETLIDFANQKLILGVLLLGSLAFLPLYSLRGMLVAVPYLGFVAYSVDSANFQPFGLMYPLLGAGPLFLALLDGLRAADPVAPGFPDDDRTSAPGRSIRAEVERSLRRRTRPLSERGAMVRTLLVSSAVFGLVFFPASPINAEVAGGYWSGAHDYANITARTPATEFLDRVLALVPENASVLTQNNLPQLSGREHVQIASAYVPGIPYDAIVMDGEVNYFSSPSSILPFVESAFANHTFGIVAEGEGALFLQRGYTGPAKLFEPLALSLAPSALSPFLARLNGSALTGSGPGYSLWFGPFLTLYPGSYTCTFLLASNTTAARLGSALTIDVTENNGRQELAHQTVYPSNFSAPGVAQPFVLSFNLSSVATQVELRGMYPTGTASISLLGIDVLQTGYGP